MNNLAAKRVLLPLATYGLRDGARVTYPAREATNLAKQGAGGFGLCVMRAA